MMGWKATEVKKIASDEAIEDTRPKVVFSAIYATIYSPEGMINGLEQNGYIVLPFNWQAARRSDTELGMQQRLIYKCSIEKPSFILLHMHQEDCLTIELVQELSKYAPVVIMTFDVRVKEEMLWMYEVSKYAALSFYACQEDVDAAKELGAENCFVLQSSCNMEWYRDLGVKEKSGIVFQGGDYFQSNMRFDNAKERHDMVKFLKNTYGDEFKAYGMGQENKPTNPQEEILVYNKAKIAICHNNFDRELYTSDRLWRAMACGTMVLTKYFDGIEALFEREVHLDWWNDFDELKNLIDCYSSQDFFRDKLALVGREYVRGQHTWAKRFEYVKELVNKYKHG